MTKFSIRIVRAAGLAYLIFNTADAFSPLSSCKIVGTILVSQPSSSSVLFVSANKKKKSEKGATSRGAGGGGFGNTRSTSSTTSRSPRPQRETVPIIQKVQLSAVEIARLNTFYIKQEEQLPQQQLDATSTITSTYPEEPLDKSSIARKARRQKWSTDETSAVEQLTAPYEEQLHLQLQRQQAQGNQNTKGQLIQLSSSPLLFTIDEFIDPEACRRVQNDATGCFDLLFPERVSDLLFNSQESEMDGLLFNKACSQDHHNLLHVYPDGLHMDTNNQCLFRHVTCILYLNDVPEECGGATVFPLARTLPDDPTLRASQRLLGHQQSHTRSRAIAHLGLEADARLLETQPVGSNVGEAANETAIRIQPKAGRLLIFFSRDSTGQEDPRAWHAGERILPDKRGTMTEKRILTLFKEVDYGGNPPSRAATTLDAYLASQIEEQRKWLQAKAQLQHALMS
jgi:2OG-Fe(II) oxygenase superfamily